MVGAVQCVTADSTSTGCLGQAQWMSVLRTVVLFVLAAFAEIGGAWLVWQGVREHRGLVWVGAGIAGGCLRNSAP